MKKVTVHASKSYDCLIGSGLLAECGPRFAAFGGSDKIMLVTDDKVASYYLETCENHLRQAGFRVYTFVIENGEKSKNSDSYLRLLNTLAEHHFTRTDSIAALGGGVVGDLSGFAAATFLRGIRYFQIPTSLLAMVDSSVGGKTAIDLPAGKNLAGAFYQPSLVLCDTDTLDTLEDQIFREGCAEIIKYAVIGDEALFASLEKTGVGFDRESVIARCIEMKKDIVETDEFDTGKRQLLNFGHTIGHAVERCSGLSIRHGQAVAIGMALMAKTLLPAAVAKRLIDLLRQFGLPVSCDFPAEQIFDAIRSDKKRKGNSLTLVVPERIGNCVLQRMPLEDLKSLCTRALSGGHLEK